MRWSWIVKRKEPWMIYQVKQGNQDTANICLVKKILKEHMYVMRNPAPWALFSWMSCCILKVWVNVQSSKIVFVSVKDIQLNVLAAFDASMILSCFDWDCAWMTLLNFPLTFWVQAMASGLHGWIGVKLVRSRDGCVCVCVWAYVWVCVCVCALSVDNKCI